MPFDTRIFPNACFKSENFNKAGPHFARELANEFFLNWKLKVLVERGTYYCKEPKVKYCQCKSNDRGLVNSLYAKELDFEAEFNEKIRSEPDQYSTEDEYDDNNYEVYLFSGFFMNFNVKCDQCDQDTIYEEEIYDECEEYDSGIGEDAEYKDKNSKIEDNCRESTSEYKELRDVISPEQQNKHFWPENNTEKQIEWNQKLTKSLIQHWPDSFDKSMTKLRCPIVVSSFYE